MSVSGLLLFVRAILYSNALHEEVLAMTIATFTHCVAAIADTPLTLMLTCMQQCGRCYSRCYGRCCDRCTLLKLDLDVYLCVSYRHLICVNTTVFVQSADALQQQTMVRTLHV
jgi:hypothetical protein